MSNIKRVYAEGWLPFNCTENDDVRNILGHTNGPIFGLRINWTNRETYIENEYGGKTCWCQYQLEGEEAVRWELLEKWAGTLREQGRLETFLATDIEGGELEVVDLMV